MKKLLAFVLLSGFAVAMTACTPEPEIIEKEVIVEVPAEPVEIPAEVTMANVDLLLERDNIQLIDLRNFMDKYKSGYIAGFENISFFEYLEGNDVLVRTDGDWTFAEEDIVDEFVLTNYFDKDADAVILMCGSGTRAGFVKAALESIGYTNVYNAGGIKDYKGDFKVDGDGSFAGKFVDTRIPTEVTMDNIDSVSDIPGVQLIDLRRAADRHTAGYIQDSVLIDFFDYLEANNYLVRTDSDWTFAAEDIVDEAVLMNMFDKDAPAIFLYCGSGTRAGFVQDALEHLGYTNVYNIGGMSAYSGDNIVYANAE